MAGEDCEIYDLISIRNEKHVEELLVTLLMPIKKIMKKKTTATTGVLKGFFFNRNNLTQNIQTQKRGLKITKKQTKQDQYLQKIVI